MNKKMLLMLILLALGLSLLIFRPAGLQGMLRRVDNGEDFIVSRQNGRVLLTGKDAGKIQIFSVKSSPDFDKVFNRKSTTSFFSIKSEVDAMVRQKQKEEQDLDGDGLSFKSEGNYGSDPAKYDTDGDGLSDGYEVGQKLNLLNPDSDYDGVKDGDELKFGTNPNDAASVYKKLDKNVDSDGDTLVDFIELSQNFPPYFDPKVPETMVLWSGEGKKVSHTVYDGSKFYPGDYEFSNCSDEGAVFVINFPKAGFDLVSHYCFPKNNNFICMDDFYPDFFKPLEDGTKHGGFYKILPPQLLYLEHPVGQTCFGKDIIWK